MINVDGSPLDAFQLKIWVRSSGDMSDTIVGDGAGNSFFVASGANDDKKRAAMERIKAFNEAQAKKRAASGIPAPAPPIVADPSAVAGQIHIDKQHHL